MSTGTTHSPPASAGRLFRTAHVLLFSGLLALWTYFLLKPNPVPESLLDGVRPDAFFGKPLDFKSLVRWITTECGATLEG